MRTGGELQKEIRSLSQQHLKGVHRKSKTRVSGTGNGLEAWEKTREQSASRRWELESEEATLAHRQSI